MNKLFIFVLLLISIALADSWVYVSTPNGSSVQVRLSSWDHSAGTKTATDNHYKAAYPAAQFLASTTRHYNCHSFAWYSSSSANFYWMNNPSAYWTDGSYSQVPGGSGLAMNDKIIYANSGGSVAHSANFMWSITLQSKWGEAPLFMHDYNDCPYWPQGYTSLYAFR